MKREELAKSQIALTREVGEYQTWGPQEIRDRQIKLAEWAPKVWPLKWK
jgi:Protein of unknown function (DUF1524)